MKRLFLLFTFLLLVAIFWPSVEEKLEDSQWDGWTGEWLHSEGWTVTVTKEEDNKYKAVHGSGAVQYFKAIDNKVTIGSTNDVGIYDYNQRKIIWNDNPSSFWSKMGKTSILLPSGTWRHSKGWNIELTQAGPDRYKAVHEGGSTQYVLVHGSQTRIENESDIGTIEQNKDESVIIEWNNGSVAWLFGFQNGHKMDQNTSRPREQTGPEHVLEVPAMLYREGEFTIIKLKVH